MRLFCLFRCFFSFVVYFIYEYVSTLPVSSHFSKQWNVISGFFRIDIEITKMKRFSPAYTHTQSVFVVFLLMWPFRWRWCACYIHSTVFLSSALFIFLLLPDRYITNGYSVFSFQESMFQLQPHDFRFEFFIAYEHIV